MKRTRVELELTDIELWALRFAVENTIGDPSIGHEWAKRHLLDKIERGTGKRRIVEEVPSPL